MFGVPTGIRTPVTAVKGRCPRPLDDGDCGLQETIDGIYTIYRTKPSLPILLRKLCISRVSSFPRRRESRIVKTLLGPRLREDDLYRSSLTLLILSIRVVLVEVSGIEPLTSCMPCKRSPS